MIKITNAKFITSAADKKQFLSPQKPIIAVSGKSNVGKSSFINLLAGQKKLARVSKEPGRTRLVNYFDFGNFMLADLPGYGYAKVAKGEKERWARLMEDFFAQRENVTHVFALVDCRHDPTSDDLQMINYLYSNLIPFTVVATKADKLSREGCRKSAVKLAANLKCGPADIIFTSAQTRQGLETVLDKIEAVLNAAKED